MAGLGAADGDCLGAGRSPGDRKYGVLPRHEIVYIKVESIGAAAIEFKDAGGRRELRGRRKEIPAAGDWIFDVEYEPSAIEIEDLVKKATIGEAFRELGGHSAGT